MIERSSPRGIILGFALRICAKRGSIPFTRSDVNPDGTFNGRAAFLSRTGREQWLRRSFASCWAPLARSLSWAGWCSATRSQTAVIHSPQTLYQCTPNRHSGAAKRRTCKRHASREIETGPNSCSVSVYGSRARASGAPRDDARQNENGACNGTPHEQLTHYSLLTTHYSQLVTQQLIATHSPNKSPSSTGSPPRRCGYQTNPGRKSAGGF